MPTMVKRISEMAGALKEMRGLLECADECIVILDRDLQVNYANPRALEVFVKSPAGPLGMSFVDLFPTSEDTLERLRLTVATGCALSFENAIHRQGKMIWMDTRCSPIRGDDGSVTALLCVSRDVTESREREQRIVQSKEHWLQAVDNLPHLLAVVNRDFHIERVNSNMANRLGMAASKVLGIRCFKGLHGINRPPSYCPLFKSLADNVNRIIEVQEKHLGCESVSLSSFRDKEGRIAGCIYVGRMGVAGHVEGEIRQCLMVLMRKVDFIVRVQDPRGRYRFLMAIAGGNFQTADVFGKTPRDFFEPSTAAEMMERIERAAWSRRGFMEASELRWKGESFHFLDQVTPLPDKDGKVELVITISKKVAESRRAAVPPRVPADGIRHLSPREREVLALIAHGLGSREIAERLCISIKTVETHRTRIMQKLNVHKMSVLVNLAVSWGVL